MRYAEPSAHAWLRFEIRIMQPLPTPSVVRRCRVAGSVMGALMQSGARPELLLVGSVGLRSAEDVFRAVSESIGDHVRRIPDGETGARTLWVCRPRKVLKSTPYASACRHPLWNILGDRGRASSFVRRRRVASSWRRAALHRAHLQMLVDDDRHQQQRDRGSRLAATNVWRE
jgi:hypothetical protein